MADHTNRQYKNPREGRITVGHGSWKASPLFWKFGFGTKISWFLYHIGYMLSKSWKIWSQITVKMAVVMRSVILLQFKKLKQRLCSFYKQNPSTASIIQINLSKLNRRYHLAIGLIPSIIFSSMGENIWLIAMGNNL